MRVRVIRLANNFYKDEQMRKTLAPIPIFPNKKLGEYCCLGYFDALDIQLLEDGEGWKGGIQKKVNQMTADGLDGNCNRKNIICVTDNDEKDELFWQSAERMPCLFISLVRIRYGKEPEREISRVVAGINKRCDMIAYYTYDHSEMVVVNAGRKYSKGVEKILSLYSDMSVFKMYSVFAIKEKELDLCAEIEDEIVNCKLSASVKDVERAKEYLDELNIFLKKGMGSVPLDGFGIISFDTLGNDDILIEILQVPITRLLQCYKMGNLLTHTNDWYKKAFFNVESQIFVKIRWQS